MADIDKVIRGLEVCSNNEGAFHCSDCPYKGESRDYRQCGEFLCEDALVVIRDQNQQICELRAENDRLKDSSKWQESIEPVLDETTKRFYRCGACGECVGFIDSDINDPDETDYFCRNCGRVVKWG